MMMMMADLLSLKTENVNKTKRQEQVKTQGLATQKYYFNTFQL